MLSACSRRQHVEPSRRRGSVARPVYRWLHVCFEDRLVLPIRPCRTESAVIPCRDQLSLDNQGTDLRNLIRSTDREWTRQRVVPVSAT